MEKFKTFLHSKNLKNILFLIYFFLLLCTLYHVYYSRRVIPGVVVGDASLGGKTYAQAKEALTLKTTNLDETITLKYNDKSYVIKAEDIGLVYDLDGTVTRAFEIGRSGNFLIDSKDKLAGLFKNLRLAAYHDYEDQKLSDIFSEVKGEFNVEEKEASLEMKDGKLAVSVESEGVKIVDDALYNVVISALDDLNFGEKELPSKKIIPQIVASDIQPLLAEVQKIVDNKITVKNGNSNWVLESPQLLGYISFTKDNAGKIEIALNEPEFNTFADQLSQEVNQLPRGKVAQTDGTKVVSFEITKEGSELNEDKFISDFKDAFFNAKPTVSIPMNSVSGPADKEKYGILELLGEGSSHYKGSAQARIHNLTLAAERTNGVLVAPGATYSLNNSVGDISAATGYDTAYIIKGDRTVLGEGGGVCQTSTTLFRAVLNSGLPVVKRYPHAYRVSYYEQDMKVGFDAAIFQPSWDFQFKNDTKGYVLVQSEANLDESSLTFKLFGTSDGRKVEITEPVITNQTPPPPALYQDDPTLAKGVVKQVDFPAWGAKVKFTRTVTSSDGKILYDDTFNSSYQPWRAIYLVGTK